MKNYVDFGKMYALLENASWWDNRDKEIAKNILFEMPIEKIRPLTLGFWKYSPSDLSNRNVVCSNCGYRPMEVGNYCQNCGAEMEQVIDNG